jgi:ribonuclease R
LRFIQDSPGPVGKREIARAFHIRGDQRLELKRLFKEMVDDGTIHKGHRHSLHEAGELPKVLVAEVSGRDRDGHALMRPDRWDSDAKPPLIYLKEGGKVAALGLGDRALVRLEKHRGIYQATVMRKLEAAAPVFLGHFTVVEGLGQIVPTNKKLRTIYHVTPEHWGAARPGDLVVAEEIRGRGRLGPRPARVREVLGSLNSPKAISLIAIHGHGIPTDFPDDVIREAKNAKPVALGKREDLRDIPLITIDPEDARDHDDAVWAEPDPANPGGWHVIVAIADVAHYVTPGSALDREAWTRGNSVYFPDRVVPMLPEELSADLCSLVPGKDRAVMAVHLWFDADGNKIRHRFVRGLMRSAANLAYEEVQAARDGHGEGLAAEMYDAVIAPLYGAFAAVDKARKKRGPLDLNMPEKKVILSADGRVADIRERITLDAHRLIENFMIAANVAAAETLEAKRELVMYRVHDEPSPEKLVALADFLNSLDIHLAKGQALSPKIFNRVLAQAVGGPHEHVVNEVVLRSQSQAIYSPDNIGHFGLALRRYAHFTSPIRRYADILVHRALISALKLGDGGLSDEDRARFAETGEHISTMERRAMLAERESVDRYLAAFMADKVGAEFAARIAGVSRAGLFVTLESSGADGLVPISTLRGDYYHLDEARHRLEGETTGRIYRLGDPVTVRLREATPVTGGLIFELLGDPLSDKKLGGSRRGKIRTGRRHATKHPKRQKRR